MLLLLLFPSSPYSLYYCVPIYNVGLSTPWQFQLRVYSWAHLDLRPVE